MKFLLVFTIFLILFESTLAVVDSPVVRTKTGPVRGKLVQVPTARQDVYEFTGIPFAEPPVGNLRFKRPVPKSPWTEILDATKPTKSCIQVLAPPGSPSRNDTSSPPPREITVPGTVEFEDCLFLNIWVPRATLDDLAAGNSRKKLAVYVFIYGGGFIGGNTMRKLYNGTLISGFNNIILVTIQHRLGSLGFAYFGKNDDAPGNAGLWDQLEALKWVNENIAAFGGDNGKVTLGGQSSGGASVTYHLVSPYSRKFFQRAIIEAGSALAPWALHVRDDAMTVTNIVLNQTCASSVNNQSSIPDKLKCLRSIDAKALAKADLVPIFMGYGYGSVPTIDGDFVPRDPRQMLADGDFYKIPLLAGANEDEGSVYLALNPDAASMLPSSNDKLRAVLHSWNFAHYTKLLKLGFYSVSGTPLPNGIDPVLFNAVQLHYWPSDQYSGFPKGPQILEATIQAAGDYALTCPTYNWANVTSSFLVQANDTPVFVYQFSQRPAGSLSPEWMGVAHGDELVYIFGEPLAPHAQSYGYGYDDKLLSKIMMEYWANFVKYGDPNKRDDFASCDVKSSPAVGPGTCRLSYWPSYVGKNCRYQIVKLDVVSQVFQYGQVVSCAFKARDCLFWADLFPKLVQLVAENNK